MDKRSWPWKKKSSDKQAAEKADGASSDSSSAIPGIGSTQVDKAKQDKKKPNYVQISMESYSHFTGLEDQVKFYEEKMQILEDEVQELNEKSSEANEEITNKENLVKQHTKVAEEAVSGWEKAEAEAAALKNHLESVTLLKLTAEDRASHLDGALKECMRQIRNLKEEHEQKLHDVVLNKTMLFEKMKQELEAKIANLDQELLVSAAENAAISRSLQERSNMLIQLSDEKSQAEAEIERLKSNIESCEKEVNSLKYELHIARKEVEIRNEEKNMSVRSADVANKQHLEGVKKIAKLEAECQRLRGLVRKKLPGPAALAQMKLEVESLGRDYGESRLKRSPVKPPTQHSSPVPEFSLDNVQKFLKENELLTERLLAMEEETKMLKEALTRRNSELQDSRSICAQTASKLQSLEAQLEVSGEHRHPLRSYPQVQIDGFSKETRNLSSFTSASENGNDDNVSCTGSWSTGFISEVSRFKKENNIGTPNKSESGSQMDLMDDFLEMEKLAHLSKESVSAADISGNLKNSESEAVKIETTVNLAFHVEPQSGEQHKSEDKLLPEEGLVVANSQLHANSLILLKLQSKVSTVLESISNAKDTEKLIGDTRSVMQDILDTLCHQSVNGRSHAQITAPEMSSCGDSMPGLNTAECVYQDLEMAISRIYDFIMILGKEAKTLPDTSPDGNGLNKKLNVFSEKYCGTSNRDVNLTYFVIDVSRVLSKASELHFNVLGFKGSEVETGCIDKIALPENKAVVDTLGERYPNCPNYLDSASDPDMPNDGNLVPTSDSTASRKCSLEEFEELKSDKDNLARELARCRENYESTKSHLLETEQLLAEVRSQLTSSQKSNSLAETQLKCMAESYNSLESRMEELQKEVNLLQGKIESLDNELQEEKQSHQEALNKCKDLQEQLERLNSCAAAEDDDKSTQEREVAAAAEKLAACQETMFVLGRQLKALQPQTDDAGSPTYGRNQKVEASVDDEPTISGMSSQDIEPSEMDTAPHSKLNRAGSESLLDALNPPSDNDLNTLLSSPVSSNSKYYQSTKLGSSTPTPEKHARGFSRFFSSKPKNSQQ